MPEEASMVRRWRGPVIGLLWLAPAPVAAASESNEAPAWWGVGVLPFVAILTAIATRSFAAEYLPGSADPDLMASISRATGGRGEIEAAQAFDPDGLEAGVSRTSFRWWFLLAAALLWPLDVALRRLRLGRREPKPRPESGQPLQPTPTTPSA